MRMRLGLLQDPAAIDRQIAREAAEAEASKHHRQKSSSVPTVKTEEQTKAEDKEKEVERKGIEGKVKGEVKEKIRAKIRPLSEAKAIDSGANFISETFLFLVAGGLIVFETARGRRNENRRRGEVAERLARVEEELRVGERERERLREEVERLRKREADKARSAIGEKAGEEGKGTTKSGESR